MASSRMSAHSSVAISLRRSPDSNPSRTTPPNAPMDPAASPDLHDFVIRERLALTAIGTGQHFLAGLPRNAIACKGIVLRQPGRHAPGQEGVGMLAKLIRRTRCRVAQAVLAALRIGGDRRDPGNQHRLVDGADVLVDHRRETPSQDRHRFRSRHDLSPGQFRLVRIERGR